MSTLEDWELKIMDLEERLRPIVQRPVDVMQPDWAKRLQSREPALDEAGARHEAETRRRWCWQV